MDTVTLFAKLPRVNIPTPLGNYNPDFGYAVHRQDAAQALYLVVETKGYESKTEIPAAERHKIDSAERFFKALQHEGVPVRFETKINRERLGDLISAIVNRPG